MPRSYEVIHETEYRYEWPADSAWQLAHLRPRVTERQTVPAHHLEIEPLPSEMDAGSDYFGNPVSQFLLATPHPVLTVRAESVVETRPRASARRPCSGRSWPTGRSTPSWSPPAGPTSWCCSFPSGGSACRPSSRDGSTAS